MLVEVATLPPSFPPSGAFCYINRPPWAKFLSPSACYRAWNMISNVIIISLKVVKIKIRILLQNKSYSIVIHNLNRFQSVSRYFFRDRDIRLLIKLIFCNSAWKPFIHSFCQLICEIARLVSCKKGFLKVNSMSCTNRCRRGEN